MMSSPPPVLRDVQIEAIRTAAEIDIVAFSMAYLREQNLGQAAELPDAVLERRVRMAIARGRMMGLTRANALRDFVEEALASVGGGGQ